MSNETLPTDALLLRWFGALEDGLCSDAHRQSLFRANAAFDDALRADFGAAVDAALRGELDDAVRTPADRLALVLLCDQLPRNLARGTPRAFAGDARALAQARLAVARGEDHALETEQRAFLYVPFEHAEDLAAQQEGIALFEALLAEHPAEGPAARAVAGYLAHAREHAALIERFGRFPHRNATLGRISTPEEQEHLARDGRSFGQ